MLRKLVAYFVILKKLYFVKNYTIIEMKSRNNIIKMILKKYIY